MHETGILLLFQVPDLSQSVESHNALAPSLIEYKALPGTPEAFLRKVKQLKSIYQEQDALK